jgi:hypothetical protein
VLADRGTIASNTMRLPNSPQTPDFTVVTTPMPFQEEVLKAVGVNLTRRRRQQAPA